MIFWDSSALVALLVDEAGSEPRRQLLRTDGDLAVWWGTPVECESAIQRRFRDGSLTRPQSRLAHDRLAELAACWHEVSPVVAVRRLARRLLRTHPLHPALLVIFAIAIAIAIGFSRAPGSDGPGKSLYTAIWRLKADSPPGFR
jgi:uncharacterized protein